MKRIIVSVLNDLETDQRVHKVCTTLSKAGYKITVIGYTLHKSYPLNREYETKRMRLFFSKGFLFFAEFNLRVFFKILFLKKDILLANDLDTLLPNFIISKLMKKKLVYDSHELYTEVPELINRPKVQAIWLAIEKFIFPKLKNVITVNKVIAEIYEKKYKVNVIVIRNIAPMLKNKNKNFELSREVKGNHKMLILQGAGINIDRGAEEAVEMMRYLENIKLFIIGSGHAIPKLKEIVCKYELQDKVKILGRKDYASLMEYTKISDLGLSLDKNTNLNYEYSLPNKIFDYIQAETPLLVSNRKIVGELVKHHNIGMVSDSHNPKKMASLVQEALSNEAQYNIWQKNLQSISNKYNWEQESQKLIKFYNSLK